MTISIKIKQKEGKGGFLESRVAFEGPSSPQSGSPTERGPLPPNASALRCAVRGPWRLPL